LVQTDKSLKLYFIAPPLWPLWHSQLSFSFALAWALRVLC